MALTVPTPPAASRQSLEEGLVRLPGRTKQALTTMAAAGEPPAVSDSHQIFTLNPQEIAGGAGLDAARAVGWRYTVNQPSASLVGGSAPATAEVSETDGIHRFSHLQHGWLADATRRAIAAAQSLPQIAGQPFELRLLRLPALLVDALWLKNTGGGEDLVVPIASLSNKLVAGQAYPPAQFLDITKQISADKKPDFNNAPPPR